MTSFFEIIWRFASFVARSSSSGARRSCHAFGEVFPATLILNHNYFRITRRQHREGAHAARAKSARKREQSRRGGAATRTEDAAAKAIANAEPFCSRRSSEPAAHPRGRVIKDRFPQASGLLMIFLMTAATRGHKEPQKEGATLSVSGGFPWLVQHLQTIPCHFDTVGVAGSIPVVPTRESPLKTRGARHRRANGPVALGLAPPHPPPLGGSSARTSVLDGR
jgi:hypothetical protein